MWTIFKFFIEFVTICFCLVFWPRGMWDLSSPTRDQTHTSCIGRQSLNHWTAREVHLPPFVEEIIFPPLNGLGILVKNQLAIDVWVYFWALNSVPLVCISILMPVPHCFDYCSFVVSFEINMHFSCNLSIFLCQNARGDLIPFGGCTIFHCMDKS